MMKLRFLVVFVLISLQLNAQEIKRWKMNDLLQYIETSDSALIINFWATFCGPCIEEIPYFQTIANKYKQEKVKLLLVSLDFKEFYPQKISAFAKKRKYNAQIVFLDEEKPDDFCPRIDSSWSGSMPATLFINSKTKHRKFIEAQIKPMELETEIKNMIGIK